MDTMPDELTLLILKDLELLDIPRIRLVSRRYASLGLQFLLTESHFFLRRNSISRLQHIANHPILCRALQHVTFFVDVAPSFADIEDWRAQAQGVCQGHDRPSKDAVAQEWLTRYRPFELVPMSRDSLPLSFVTAGWKYQLAMEREQDDLRNANTYSRLKKTLRKLVNLRSFTLDSFESYHQDLMRQLYVSQHSQVWYCWNRMHSRASDEYNAAQLYATVIAASLPEIGSGPLSVNTIGYSLFQNACNEMIPSTARAERMGQSSLRSVSFGNKRVATISELQETSLALTVDGSVTTTGDPKGIASLSTFLSSVTNLEHLSLSVIESPALRSEEFFKSETWQDLSELCISFIDIHQVSFQDFLQSHATKLKTLKIKSANLRNDWSERLWCEMLQFLATQLQLNIFELDGTPTENDEIELDLLDCWTFPGGHMVHAKLMAEYLVVGDSNMEENDKLTMAEIRHNLSFGSSEAAVYYD